MAEPRAGDRIPVIGSWAVGPASGWRSPSRHVGDSLGRQAPLVAPTDWPDKVREDSPLGPLPVGVDDAVEAPLQDVLRCTHLITISRISLETPAISNKRSHLSG